jgi:hypothetical protein
MKKEHNFTVILTIVRTNTLGDHQIIKVPYFWQNMDNNILVKQKWELGVGGCYKLGYPGCRRNKVK